MTPNRAIALAFALTALACSSASAQRMIKCVDAKGKTYYTQIPPPECAGKTTQELSKQGRVVRQNEVLTAEQAAAREAENKKKAEQAQLAREEQRKNTALLNTYSSEKDIEDARGRTLKQSEEQIKAIEKRVTAAKKRRGDFEKEKEFYSKKPLPAKLTQDIQNNEIEINTQRDLLDAKKRETGSINARYDEDKRRFLELTRGGAKK
jgi:hypothetical protein